MRGHRDMDDPDFDATWRAFAAEEARVEAPGHLRPAVMAAWDAAHARPAQGSPRGRRNVPAFAALAAAALLLAVGLAVRHRSGGGSADESSAASGEASRVESGATGQVVVPVSPVRASATPDVGPGVVPTEIGRQRVPQSPGRSALRDRAPGLRVGAIRITADPIVTLAVDQTFETEAFQIMRVRVPRGAIQAFGVPLPDPEAEGLVDVDVLVGDDGLARDIRRIRPVVDAGTGYDSR